ncbi:MAG TPA: hypothetical protein PKB15_08010 [Acidimicrobiia bacterium]|nr:hypothetical protein [Acidimicrobiia bacterium]
MSNSSEEYSLSSREVVDDTVKRRASELRKSKNFDPRREKELNDLYDQYVPPHSLEETSHLLDVAERDAYIDPFPPIGSQKMAGAVIKKGVRVAIGWYIQYLAQQISTFGSGVAQALRSLNKDVQELKKTAGNADGSQLLRGLDLETIDAALWSMISTKTVFGEGRIIVSDAIDSALLTAIGSQIIVVDPRSRVCSELPASMDSRCRDIFPLIKEYEDQSLAGLVLHGRIDFLASANKLELIRECSRVLSEDAPLILVVRTEITGDSATIAAELSGTDVWSEKTWAHVVSQMFNNHSVIDTGQSGISVFVTKSKTHTL